MVISLRTIQLNPKDCNCQGFVYSCMFSVSTNNRVVVKVKIYTVLAWLARLCRWEESEEIKAH